MDPVVTMHVGLVGAPALKPGEYVKHPKSFQMVAIVRRQHSRQHVRQRSADQPRHQPLVVSAGRRHGHPVWREASGPLSRPEQQPVRLHRQHRCQRAGRRAVAGSRVRPREPPDAQLHAEVVELARRSAISTAERPPPTATTTTTSPTRSVAGSRSATSSHRTSDPGCRSATVLAKKGDAEETLFRFQIAYSF